MPTKVLGSKVARKKAATKSVAVKVAKKAIRSKAATDAAIKAAAIKAAAVKTAAKNVIVMTAKKAAKKASKKKASSIPAVPKDNRNNERLRELVTVLGWTQEDALSAFNAEIGLKKVSMAAWKSYFVRPDSTRHRKFGDVLLAHAEKTFDHRACE